MLIDPQVGSIGLVIINPDDLLTISIFPPSIISIAILESLDTRLTDPVAYKVME